MKNIMNTVLTSTRETLSQQAEECLAQAAYYARKDLHHLAAAERARSQAYEVALNLVEADLEVLNQL